MAYATQMLTYSSEMILHLLEATMVSFWTVAVLMDLGIIYHMYYLSMSAALCMHM